MDMDDAGQHCEKAWAQYAEKNNICRDDEFYLFKMQEELGELTRAFLELRGSERRGTKASEELLQKFAGDVASLVGNALILARHFQVDLVDNIKAKFPVEE